MHHFSWIVCLLLSYSALLYLSLNAKCVNFLQTLLEQDVFHRSLLACCLEIVIFSYNSQRWVNYNHGQNVWDKVSFSRIAAVFARSPLPPRCNVGRLVGKPFLTNNIAWGEGGKVGFGPKNVGFHVKNWSMVEAVHSASLSHIILARIVACQVRSEQLLLLSLSLLLLFSIICLANITCSSFSCQYENWTPLISQCVLYYLSELFRGLLVCSIFGRTTSTR